MKAEVTRIIILFAFFSLMMAMSIVDMTIGEKIDNLLAILP